jgi:hypothetical protein
MRAAYHAPMSMISLHNNKLARLKETAVSTWPELDDLPSE